MRVPLILFLILATVFAVLPASGAPARAQAGDSGFAFDGGLDEFRFSKMDLLPKEFDGQTVFGVPVGDEGLRFQSGKASLGRDGTLNIEIHGLRTADGFIPLMELGAVVSCLDPATGLATLRSEGAFWVDPFGDAIHQGAVNIGGGDCMLPHVFATTPDGKAFAIGRR